MIFVPIDKSKEYYRWTLVTTFVIVMLWLISVFYGDYQKAENTKINLSRQIQDIKSRPPPPPLTHHAIKKKKSGGKTDKIIEQPVPVSDSTIEIDALIVKVKMSNESSWNAIVKMLVTVLSMFFGIKLINLFFVRISK